jgi:hypothetical protein
MLRHLIARLVIVSIVLAALAGQPAQALTGNEVGVVIRLIL